MSWLLNGVQISDDDNIMPQEKITQQIPRNLNPIYPSIKIDWQ